jgi:RHS repeat-associated protein
LKVDDNSSETASFKDVVGDDYEYWLDGSLKKDNNKEITQIDYNYLKLPEQITLTTGRWIKYEYDAGGTKLKKTLSTGKYTDYEEDEIYEDGVLYQTSHDEGRIVNDEYEYNIKDHLGNLRVAFKDSLGIAKITQVNAYGAFGDDLPTLRYVNSSKKNRFGFNLKEEENDFGIGYNDFKWRFSDQILGRFFTIDRLAEKYSDISTYQFASNDPINKLEIDGLEGLYYMEKDANGIDRQVVEKNVVVLTQQTKEIPKNATEKQVQKIERQNARIEKNNAEKVESVKTELANFYSGATDEKGKAVNFKFNVSAKKVADTKGGDNGQIITMALANGLQSSEKDFSGNNKVAPAAIVTTGSTKGSLGLSNGFFVNIAGNAPVGTVAHEVSHTLLLNDNNYTSGGILNSPPDSIVPSEVKEIIQKSLKK